MIGYPQTRTPRAMPGHPQTRTPRAMIRHPQGDVPTLNHIHRWVARIFGAMPGHPRHDRASTIPGHPQGDVPTLNRCPRRGDNRQIVIFIFTIPCASPARPGQGRDIPLRVSWFAGSWSPPACPDMHVSRHPLSRVLSSTLLHSTIPRIGAWVPV